VAIELSQCLLRVGADRASHVMRKAAPDRSKISMQNDYEVKYWARHFGVTRKHLRRAIEKVGNSAASVRKELKMRSLDPQSCEETC
jgi:AraC-like DNA-binding protein